MKALLVGLALMASPADTPVPKPAPTPTGIVLLSACGKVYEVIVVMSNGTYVLGKDLPAGGIPVVQLDKITPKKLDYVHPLLCTHVFTLI